MNEAEPTDADLWEAATTTGHASLGVCLETLNASFAQGEHPFCEACAPVWLAGSTASTVYVIWTLFTFTYTCL